MVQREPRALHCIATWKAPASRAAAFLAACSGMTIRPGVDLAGEVWQSGAPVRVSDLRERLDFPRTPLAIREGLRAALALPITLGREVLGVLEFFERTAGAPQEDLAPLLTGLGGQIAQFVERAEADKALRSSDDRMRAVIENMLEALITITQRSVIESVNPAAERMFGYAAWELVGQHLKILMPQSMSAQGDRFLRDAAARALGRLTEWEGRRKNGELFRFELSLFEFQTPDGRHFAGHMRDISDRTKLERMKQEFVATVSHELRTPLTSIRGSLSLLAGGVLGELPDEAKEVVGIAERNTVRLVALINDILDLERLKMGKMEMHFASLPAETILERSLESVRAFAEQQGVKLEAVPAPATVFADADRLVQVLVNLLSNAIKFSPRGSPVRVSTREGEDGVEFSVADEGRGIPAPHHSAIFERFRQVEASDSREKGGTGLGLAICKAIVEQHGGAIGVVSAPGQGSRFWFRVPARPPATRAEDADHLLQAVQDSAAETPSRHVLLADDDEALLGVMTRQLLQHGIPVRATRNGREALDLARQTPPAVLVLDVNLPDADGFALVAGLRGEAHLRTLPVLVYTGRDLTGEERERLTLGPTRFLTKSRATDLEFQALVSELLGPSALPEDGR
jgi:PAS domain S-box-containing protein